MISYKLNDTVFIIIHAKGFDGEKDIPIGATNIKAVTKSDLPSRLLRNAWDCDSNSVFVDMVKGKELAHVARRIKRDAAFAPNLDIIDRSSKSIPLAASESESSSRASNAAIKSADDLEQSAINSASNESELVSIMEG